MHTDNKLLQSFQSSSYWRMAESVDEVVARETSWVCFNPHHTGEWLKRPKGVTENVNARTRFNPHHTGEWLKS